MNKLKDFFSKEFIKFLCCNGFAAVVNFTSRILFDVYLSYLASIVIAYCCGMITAFVLNKIFVFKVSKKSMKQQIAGFIFVNVIAVLQTVLLSMLFREIIFPSVGMNYRADEVAHLIGISVPVFTSFIGHKYLSFGSEKGK